jgi:hypothetical protein
MGYAQVQLFVRLSPTRICTVCQIDQAPVLCLLCLGLCGDERERPLEDTLVMILSGVGEHTTQR